MEQVEDQVKIKRHVPLLLGLILSLSMCVFFIHTVNALNLVTNEKDDLYCLGVQGRSDCSGNTVNDWQQKIKVNLIQEYPTFNINDIGIYVQNINVDSASDAITIYLYNSAGQDLASTTVNNPSWSAGWNDFALDYSIDDTTIASHLPEWILWDWTQDTTQLDVKLATSSYGLPWVGTFNTTTIGGFADTYPGKQGGTPWFLGNMPVYDDLEDNHQIAFRILSDDDDYLTIDQPDDLVVYGEDLTASGTCSDSFELYFYQGSIATSTAQLVGGQSTGCTDGTWSYHIGTLYESDNYLLVAVGDGQYVERSFYYVAQSYQPGEFVLPPWGYATETATHTYAFILDYAQERMNLRPFSYFVEIANTIYSAIQNATSSDWISDVTVTVAGVDRTIPGLKKSLFDDIDSDFKTNIRNFAAYFWWAILIFYLWKIRFRFI